MHRIAIAASAIIVALTASSARAQMACPHCNGTASAFAVYSARHMGEKALWVGSKAHWKLYRMMTVKAPYPGDCPPRPYYPWRHLIMAVACKIHKMHARLKMTSRSSNRWAAHAPADCHTCATRSPVPSTGVAQPVRRVAPPNPPTPIVVVPQTRPVQPAGFHGGVR